jgi:hypothetical protein
LAWRRRPASAPNQRGANPGSRSLTSDGGANEGSTLALETISTWDSRVAEMLVVGGGNAQAVKHPVQP